MVFEPVSVVGIVGTLAGLISFIANTVENLHTRTRLYQECFNKLSTYSSEFKQSLRELKRWQTDWCRSDQAPYEAAEYRYLWGRRGFREIQHMLALLNEDATYIQSIFRFSYEGKDEFRWSDMPSRFRGRPKELDIYDWDRLLDFHTSRTKLILEPDSSTAKLFLKFSFAIHKNGDIKNRLSDFKEKLDLLRRSSKGLFWQRHSYADMTRSADPEYLERLNTLELSRQKFLDFFKKISQEHDSRQYKWELVLAETDDDGGPAEPAFPLNVYLHNVELKTAINCLIDSTNLSCNFFAQNANNNESVGHTFTVDYPRHTHHYYTNIGLIGLWNEYSEAQLIQSQPSLRGALRRSTEPELWHQAEQLHRLVSIAAYVSRAVILFHGTRWVQDICACRIINPNLSSGDSSRQVMTLSPFQFSDTDEDCTHFPQHGYRITFLLLGVLLIEIAIAGQVSVQIVRNEREGSGPGEEELLFTLPEESLPPGFANPLASSRLLPNLLEMLPPTAMGHIGTAYKRAVLECFEMRNRLLMRQGGRLWADELEGCSEKIAKP
jgi:hypothetical protein